MAGRPPSLTARQDSRRVGPLQLPAEGRTGRAPAWPLQGRMRVGEKAAWDGLWHTPQAVAWERLGWTRVVARYCRIMVLAEDGSNKDAMAEARQLEDRLGLTPKAMRLLLWTIVGDTLQERRAALAEKERREREAQEPGSVRARVRAVDPG